MEKNIQGYCYEMFIHKNHLLNYILWFTLNLFDGTLVQ